MHRTSSGFAPHTTCVASRSTTFAPYMSSALSVHNHMPRARLNIDALQPHMCKQPPALPSAALVMRAQLTNYATPSPKPVSEPIEAVSAATHLDWYNMRPAANSCVSVCSERWRGEGAVPLGKERLCLKHLIKSQQFGDEILHKQVLHGDGTVLVTGRLG